MHCAGLEARDDNKRQIRSQNAEALKAKLLVGGGRRFGEVKHPASRLSSSQAPKPARSVCEEDHRIMITFVNEI